VIGGAMSLNNRLLTFIGMLSLAPMLVNSCPDLSPAYGIESLKISDNAEVYFKREVRGQNYDSLVLSPKKNHCDLPSKSDYIFRGQGPYLVYYKVENDTLILFTTSDVTPPAEGTFPGKVLLNKMHPLDFVELRENYQKLGLKPLDVEVNKALRCQ
jgi:hypothetical protein